MNRRDSGNSTTSSYISSLHSEGQASRRSSAISQISSAVSGRYNSRSDYSSSPFDPISAGSSRRSSEVDDGLENSTQTLGPFSISTVQRFVRRSTNLLNESTTSNMSVIEGNSNLEIQPQSVALKQDAAAEQHWMAGWVQKSLTLSQEKRRSSEPSQRVPGVPNQQQPQMHRYSSYNNFANQAQGYAASQSSNMSVTQSINGQHYEDEMIIPDEMASYISDSNQPPSSAPVQGQNPANFCPPPQQPIAAHNGNPFQYQQQPPQFQQSSIHASSLQTNLGPGSCSKSNSYSSASVCSGSSGHQIPPINQPAGNYNHHYYPNYAPPPPIYNSNMNPNPCPPQSECYPSHHNLVQASPQQPPPSQNYNTGYYPGQSCYNSAQGPPQTCSHGHVNCQQRPQPWNQQQPPPAHPPWNNSCHGSQQQPNGHWRPPMASHNNVNNNQVRPPMQQHPIPWNGQHFQNASIPPGPMSNPVEIHPQSRAYNNMPYQIQNHPLSPQQQAPQCPSPMSSIRSYRSQASSFHPPSPSEVQSRNVSSNNQIGFVQQRMPSNSAIQQQMIPPQMPPPTSNTTVQMGPRSANGDMKPDKYRERRTREYVEQCRKQLIASNGSSSPNGRNECNPLSPDSTTDVCQRVSNRNSRTKQVSAPTNSNMYNSNHQVSIPNNTPLNNMNSVQPLEQNRHQTMHQQHFPNNAQSSGHHRQNQNPPHQQQRL